MKPEELFEIAIDQVRMKKKAGQDTSTAVVSIEMPGKWGKRIKKSLCKGGPKGEIVQDTTNGLVVIFNAIEIIEFLTTGIAQLRRGTGSPQ